MRISYLVGIVLFTLISACKSDDQPILIPTPADEEICMELSEKSLYDALMDYRAENGKAAIPISVSLTEVAQLHAKDLDEYFSEFAEGCNQHSWSDNGNWIPCCYDDAHNVPECMWEKPREITNYPAIGYEIVAWSSDIENNALNLWKNSAPHNNMILNLDIWTQTKWEAIGVATKGIYAIVWFGEDIDPDGTTDQCP